MAAHIRRTSGIRHESDPTSLGHDIALRQNTPREVAAARRTVERAARDEDDRDLLMAALGLNGLITYAALLTYSAAYFTWARHANHGGTHS